jgi:Flp pilus assembly pilin Flp
MMVSVAGPSLDTLIGFLQNSSGATSIEYAMIACGIAVVVLAGNSNLGSTVKSKLRP